MRLSVLFICVCTTLNVALVRFRSCPWAIHMTAFHAVVTVSVRCNCPALARPTASLTDLDNGTYNVTFKLGTGRLFMVAVFLDGVHIPREFIRRNNMVIYNHGA